MLYDRYYLKKILLIHIYRYICCAWDACPVYPKLKNKVFFAFLDTGNTKEILGYSCEQI